MSQVFIFVEQEMRDKKWIFCFNSNSTWVDEKRLDKKVTLNTFDS